MRVREPVTCPHEIKVELYTLPDGNRRFRCFLCGEEEILDPAQVKTAGKAGMLAKPLLSPGLVDPGPAEMARAVTASTAIGNAERCDFCSILSTALKEPLVSFAAGTIQFQAVLGGPMCVFEDDWGACPKCAELVRQRDLQGLVGRCVGASERKRGRHSPHLKAFTQDLIRLYTMVFNNLDQVGRHQGGIG